jgi:Flp pilus assembly pilin Flp
MICVRQFRDSEAGQDLVEWALLIALVVLGSAGLMYSTKDPVAKIWTATNTALTVPAGASTPAPSQPTQPPKDGGGDGHGGDGGHGDN